jgi:hypothetical protein
MNLPGRVIDLVCIALAQRIKKEILDNPFYKTVYFMDLYDFASGWHRRLVTRQSIADTMGDGDTFPGIEKLANDIRKDCLRIAVPLKLKLKTVTDRDEYMVFRGVQDELHEVLERSKVLVHLCDVLELDLTPEEMLGEMKDVLYRHLGAFYATAPVVNELKKILAQY